MRGNNAGAAFITYTTTAIPSALVAFKGLTQLKKVYDASGHWNSDKRLVVGKLKDLQTQQYQQPYQQPTIMPVTMIKEDQREAAQASTKEPVQQPILK